MPKTKTENSRRVIATTPQPSSVGSRLGLILVSALFFAGLALAVVTAFRNQIGGYFKPNIAAEARAYLLENKVTAISESLSDLLKNSAEKAISSQEHPLLGKSAPNFTLPDDRGETIELQSQIGKGCVVLIFYYGYHCNHCVGQLFAVNDDLKKFRELGANVFAISADEASETQKRFDEYGRFEFSVLSDLGNKVAGEYGAYFPAKGDEGEHLEHATFVIDDEGIVRWTNHGDEPFTDNKTLLVEIAKAQGRIPHLSTPPTKTNPN